MSSIFWKVCRVVTCLVLLFVLSTVALAQKQGLTIQNLDISVKPEYDQRDVLVIYDAVFVNNNPQPFSGDVSFRVPKDLQLGQTCELNQKGEHLCQLPKVEDKGEYKLVSWAIGRTLKPGESYHGYMEFYYNPLQVSAGGNKTMTYEFYPLFPVQQMNISVVPPLRSSNVKLSPSPVSSVPVVFNGAQFTAYNYQFSNLTTDEPVKLVLSYTKPDDKPSVRKQTGVPAAGGKTAPQVSAAGGKFTVIGLVVLLAGVLGSFIYYASTTRKGHRVAPVPQQLKSRRPGSTGSMRSDLSPLSPMEERKRARELLLKGRISEQTYKEIIRDIERETQK